MNAHHTHLGTNDADEFARIDTVIAEIARGGMVVLLDDEGRENEGDLVVAAEFATPAVVNFMITHARGLLCMAITEDRAHALGLSPMGETNNESHGTAFTISVDGGEEHGVTTGISAHERSTTIRLIREGTSADIRTPGHMFPLVARAGGTLERAGHTEASVDLARLAGLFPAAVIIEIIGDDGHMLRRDGLVEFARTHGLPISTIDILRQHLSGDQ